MRNRIFILLCFLLKLQFSYSQELSFQALLDSGKAAFKLQDRGEKPDYTVAFDLLTKAIKMNPNNAEARYFLGYTIDRLNAYDGSKMNLNRKESVIKISEQFEQVNRLQKEYTGEIYLLDPYSKITSSWGSLAQAYLVQNKLDSAKWAFLEGKGRGGFIEPVLEFNRQMMNSCKKNAILITIGDIYTIPAWYLQTIENFRSDITIIDANLINSDWYPKYLKHNQHLDMTLSDQELDTINYLPWTPTAYSIANPKETAQFFSWIFKATYYDQYVLRGDRILLDIFKTNVFQRDFYFAGVPDSTYNLNLSDYIIDDGIVTRVMVQQNNLSSSPTVLSQNLEKYTIEKLNAEDIRKSRETVRLLNNYRFTFLGNCQFLYSKGEKKEANRLFQVMDTKFNEQKLPYISDEFHKEVEDFRALLE